VDDEDEFIFTHGEGIPPFHGIAPGQRWAACQERKASHTLRGLAISGVSLAQRGGFAKG